MSENNVTTITTMDMDLDNDVEAWKVETNELLDEGIGNRSATKTTIKKARRQAALLQHKCRLEEDYDLVGEIRSYLRSIRTLEFGLKGNRF